MLKKDAESETVFMILDNAGSQGMIAVEQYANDLTSFGGRHRSDAICV